MTDAEVLGLVLWLLFLVVAIAWCAVAGALVPALVLGGVLAATLVTWWAVRS